MGLDGVPLAGCRDVFLPRFVPLCFRLLQTGAAIEHSPHERCREKERNNVAKKEDGFGMAVHGAGGGAVRGGGGVFGGVDGCGGLGGVG